MRPLVSSSDECEKLARGSLLFWDPIIMKKLINYGPKDFERHILVTSSIIRGIENILKALPDGSYINFLKDNRLLDPLVKKVAQYT